MNTEKFDFETYIDIAINELSNGNDGDATYHPLYKAWRSIQSMPTCLAMASNPAKVGMGMLIFLSYGTVSDIDDRQQISSIAYLMLSKAIEDGNQSANVYKNRILLLHQESEAFNYTISSVVNKGHDFWMMSMEPFKARDSNWMMQYADIIKAPGLMTVDLFNTVKLDIEDKIKKDFFLPAKNRVDVIIEGEKLHKQLYEYLSEKIFENGDIDF